MIAIGAWVRIYSGPHYGSVGRVTGVMPGGRWMIVRVGAGVSQVHVSDLEVEKNNNVVRMEVAR